VEEAIGINLSIPQGGIVASRNLRSEVFDPALGWIASPSQTLPGHSQLTNKVSWRPLDNGERIGYPTETVAEKQLGGFS
jgi:hypothetical protein